MRFPLAYVPHIASAVVTTAALSIATPAAGYPVDCAILLCLAGGWPASVECTQARAVFIARITPWPVEPPLQIWNCPMHAAARRPAPVERILEVAFRDTKWSMMSKALSLPLAPLPVADQADIDISDPAYDFVRSIHVFQIEYHQDRSDSGNCSRGVIINKGSYGTQGDFVWSPASLDEVPDASALAPSEDCRGYLFRSVFVDWKDYEGIYGFEEVLY